MAATAATSGKFALVIDTRFSSLHSRVSCVCSVWLTGSIFPGAITLTGRACSRRPTQSRWSAATDVVVVVDHHDGGFEGVS